MQNHENPALLQDERKLTSPPERPLVRTLFKRDSAQATAPTFTTRVAMPMTPSMA